MKIPVGIGSSIDISIAGEDTLSLKHDNVLLLVTRSTVKGIAIHDFGFSVITRKWL